MRPRWLLAFGLAGCADPVLAPVKAALLHYDAGRAALDDGDAAGAQRSFAQARTAQPDAPSLLVWEAFAARQAGQTEDALRILDQGVSRWPAHPEVRVHRAALLVLTGDLDGGAADLRAAYATGQVHPTDLASDVDFAPLAASAEHRALVPPPSAALQARGESGAVLLGDRWTAVVSLQTPLGAPVALEVARPMPEMLALSEVVEECEATSAELGTETRTVRFRYRTVASGEGELGPFALAAGPAVGEAPAVPVSVLPVPGRSSSSAPPAQPLLLPSQLGSSDPSPRLAQSAGGTVLTAPPGARVGLVSPEGTPLEPLRLELREDGATRLVRYWLPAGTAGRATVTRGGVTLLDDPLP